jgi:hypothetical protein
MKTKERKLARHLRQEGRSMKEISRIVGCSLSSVSNWTRDVALTPGQCAALRSRNPSINGQLVAAANRSRALGQRQAFQDAGHSAAQRGSLIHAAGCMLYWAEGSKSRNSVLFVNSDPAMARYFVDFLRACFAVPPEKFRVDCNLFADHIARQREIEQFWMETLDLPPTCLRKSTVNVYSKHSKKKRRNKLPYGTVRVCVHSTEIVQSIYGSIQEYGGFERPEWLG